MRLDGMRQRPSARSTGRCAPGAARPCWASLRRGCANCARLAIHEVGSLVRASARGAVRETPLDAIMGSVEPNRATLFDREFRPSRAGARPVAQRLACRTARRRAAPHLGRRTSMMGMRSVTATTACPLPGRAERSASSPRSLERRLRRYRASGCCASRVAPRTVHERYCIRHETGARASADSSSAGFLLVPSKRVVLSPPRARSRRKQ